MGLLLAQERGGGSETDVSARAPETEEDLGLLPLSLQKSYSVEGCWKRMVFISEDASEGSGSRAYLHKWDHLWNV